jgi:superfamily II DNA or RNA helicase
VDELVIMMDDLIRIIKDDLPPKLIDTLKVQLIFENPLYLKNLRYGRPVHGVSPHLFAIWTEGEDLLIPRGFARQLFALLHAHRIAFTLQDRTRRVAAIDLTFCGTLHGYQIEAVEDLIKHHFGVLTAPLGSGKKVIALALIARTRLPALVIVRTRHELYYWKELAGRFLGLGKEEIGMIGDGHRRLGKITIAISVSLYKVLKNVRPKIGFLVVDSCDRANLKVFTHAVLGFDCSRQLGLAASAKRSDSLTGLMYAYMGNQIHEIKGRQRFEGMGKARPRLRIQKTGFHDAESRDYQDLVNSLIKDRDRNRMIVADILQEAADPVTRALVVSDRKEHLAILSGMIEEAQGQAAIINGATPESARERIVQSFETGISRVILMTLRSVASLELKRVDRLVVASPFKFHDFLSQVVGKILGAEQGDRPALIYEYLDQPQLLRDSFSRRLKAYRSMGAVDD